MKQLSLLTFFTFSFLLICCKKEKECVFNQLRPSIYRAYVPYEKGDYIIFKNEAGLKQILSVADFQAEEFIPSRHYCPYKHEKIECLIQTTWTAPDSSNNNPLIEFRDWVVTGNSLTISSDPPIFHTTNFSNPGPGGEIKFLDSITFANHKYYDVYLASCPPADSVCFFIESLGFVKDRGLAFYTLNGEQWVLEE
ncbi:MAG: hypothetical protein AAFZ15_07430 [Bacteroidota bacterium]